MEPGWFFESMAYYCHLSDGLELKPVKGKDQIWVEKAGGRYIAYWHGRKDNVWYGFVFESDGTFVGGYQNPDPFDYREVLKEWL